MKERKKRLKRLLAVALSLVVIGGSANLPALTSLAEGGEPDQADVLTSKEDGETPEASETDNNESENKQPEDKTLTDKKQEGASDKKPEDKGQEASQTGKPQEVTEKPEDNQEADDELVEEKIDLSGYIYQCGGFGVMDMPMMLSLDEESGARAASDKEGAKTAILNGLKAWETTIDISAYQISTGEIGAFYAELVNANPELFFVTGGVKWNYSPSNNTVISIIPEYNTAYTAQSVSVFENAFNKAYSEAVPNPAGMSKLQIARACHDYLAQHMSYDENLQKRDVYAAFVEGTGVCQGYSLAYGAMMKRAGIPFDYVNSKAMNHMWNVVQLGGNWYHVDVTWDDPTADRLGFVRHNYFLNSDTKIGSEGKDGHYEWTTARSCTSAAYDNAYWQGGVSAIFTIDGKDYYLKYPTSGNSFENLLVSRSGDKEETVASFTATWPAENGGYWQGSYSRLSCYDGRLYFNDTKNIYRVDPKAASVADNKKVVYTYTGSAGSLYGSLVCDDKIRMQVSPSPNDTGTRIEEPLPTGAIKDVTVTAEPSSVEYGYQTPPKMKASVTGAVEAANVTYEWYDVTTGSERLISSTGAECVAEANLPVGTHTYRVKASFEDSRMSADVTFTVLPKKVKPEVTITGEYTYELGKEILPSHTVVVKAADSTGVDITLEKDKDYTVEYRDNINAGTGKMVVTPKEGCNYTWDSLEAAFTINKLAKENEKIEIKNGYGNTGTYDLKLPEGAKTGQIEVKDPEQVLSKVPSLTEAGGLSYTLVNDNKNKDKQAVITIPVTEAMNYLPYNIEVTITVVDKLSQSDFRFVTPVENREYGASDFTVGTTGSAQGSKVTYNIEDTDIADIDNNGKVHIKKAGMTRMIAVASSTEEYAETTAYAELYVSKATLSWDTSDLGAADRADNAAGDAKTDAKATLYGSLKINGVIGSDDVKFVCGSDKITGTYKGLKAGKQEVTLAWKDGIPVVLTGADADNYKYPDSLPTITGNITKITIQDVEVENGEEGVVYKLKHESGITYVPAGLEKKFETPIQITNSMKSKTLAEIGKKFGTNSAEIAEVEVYDVTLCIVNEKGELVEVDSENFPKEGVVVKLAYPEGTGKGTHNFVAAHMLTVDSKDMKAGDIEYPAITKTDAGVEFRVFSLSPIALGWSEIEPVRAEGGSGGSNLGSGKGTAVPSKKPSPKTGDTNTILLYVLFLMMGAAGIGYTVKRRAMR